MIFTEISFDQWMNAIGICGVTSYLGLLWLHLSGSTPADSRFFRVLRLLALALILVPLFLRWYLSVSLLTVVGLLLAGAAAIIVWRQQDR